ncbi:MAG: tRNA epoxyqueuosine(34) reductase QueG [Candidatus Omnitrophota bacterium]|nr:tRNA epoxyqueuosine(34) reductase QueG [Candidatus Omnitrophota bacterium]
MDVKALAREVGFDVVGITEIASLEKGKEAILQWVREGKHGTMRYLEDYAARFDRLFKDFPDARGVIVLGTNYYQKAPEEWAETETRGRGRVARYAWGQDYHEVIRERHAKLIARLREKTGEVLRATSCVDTQPLPERFAAQQAGLGFFGKHTGLLSKDFGPWLFISEIVTNLDLTPDMPDSGNCGTCVECQRICPTGALDEDYRMDARLCISYLTIEHKGVIPRELRPKIKDWIFGCDECLEVCPFTSKAKTEIWDEFKPAAGAGSVLDLEKIISLTTNSRHETMFRSSALKRAGRKQMLRNACIVLGNSGSRGAVGLLEKALQDSAPLVRLHAAWGLGQLPYPEARGILENRAAVESDPDVQGEIRAALNPLEIP